MLTLLTEVKFWTARDDISIKDTDFGAFRYQNKKEPSTINQDYADGKQNYAEKRDYTCNLDNKRPTKLRTSIKKLESYLKHNEIVYCQWRDAAVIEILLSNGLLVHICINIFTGDIMKMAFDKFFVGKLITETVTDAIITRMHILIAYNQNQLTFVYLQKPNMKRSAPEKISRMDPKIFNVIINGPQNRTISRHLACNNSFDLVAVWTKSSQNEVYPWRPTVRDQDRANVHIYKISRTKMESICYYWTENDPINIEFSRTNQNQLHSVEQKISRKGEVTIEICIYEISKSKLQRIAVTSIPLQTQVCCHAFSTDNEKLMLGCIDGSVVIFDEGRGITHLVKAAFIPTMVTWHCDSALLMVANERCQFQCFDISLACVKNQLISEDMTPTNLLDLSGYFLSQPNLLKVLWNKKPDVAVHNDKFAQSDGFLLLLFENGPVACLRFFAGTGLKGDVHTSGLTSDVLIHKYLNLNFIEKAINLLLCLNWDTYGAMCLVALHKIANYIFRLPLTPEREIQFQKALGSFHVPVKPLCDDTDYEFGDQVRDITRKFFQYLLRYKSYEKAFSLAIDINDEDLFMDLHNCAKSDGNLDLAVDAYRKAEEILARMDGQNSIHSACSRSSCSECSVDSSVENDDRSKSTKSIVSGYKKKVPALPSSSLSIPQLLQDASKKLAQDLSKEHPPLPVIDPRRNKYRTNDKKNSSYVPPLPFSSNSKSTAHQQRVNIPKPELKVSTYSKKQQQQKSKVRYYPSATALISASNNPNHKYKLVDPPLPTIKRTTSHDNILQHYTEPIDAVNKNRSTTTTTSYNSFSTNNLNEISQREPTSRDAQTRNDNISSESFKVGRIPRALPRTTSVTDYLQTAISGAASVAAAHQQHVVIDVVPKPNAIQQLQTEWKVPDQTLGIPLTYASNSHISAYHNFVGRPTASKLQQQQLNYVLPPSSTASHQRALLKSQSMYNIPAAPMIHQHPITLATIPPPPAATSFSENIYHSQLIDVKKSSIIHATAAVTKTVKDGGIGTPQQTNSILSGQIVMKKESGEKNKVKFSDTITVAVVPEIPRKDKLSVDRLKRPNGFRSRLTDQQRELADSLPLCHPNDDYLKDFAPMSAEKKPDEEKNNPNRSNSSQIKVVHFGVV